MTTLNTTWSTTTPGLAMAGPRGFEALAPNRAKGDTLRKQVGEFVGNVFYGTLMKQMQASKLKGKYLHGGRGEEVFKGQLHMELAKRMGQAAGDPIAESMYRAFARNAEANAETPKRRNAETGDSNLAIGNKKNGELLAK